MTACLFRDFLLIINFLVSIDPVILFQPMRGTPENTEQRNNGISENYILNILLLYIQSIAFIQYSPHNNSTENH